MRTRPLRVTPAVHEIVRAKWFLGWWVKTWVGNKVGDPIIEIWFPTRRGADKYVNGRKYDRSVA